MQGTTEVTAREIITLSAKLDGLSSLETGAAKVLTGFIPETKPESCDETLDNRATVAPAGADLHEVGLPWPVVLVLVLLRRWKLCEL